MAVDKVQFYELSQSVYDNLENKEPYSFYDTEDNVYLGDKILTGESSSSAICLSGTLYSSQWTSNNIYYLMFDLSEYHLYDDDICGILGFSPRVYNQSNIPNIGIYYQWRSSSQNDGTIETYSFQIYCFETETPTEDIDVNLILFKK